MRNLLIILTSVLLSIPCTAAVITVDDDGTVGFNDIKAAIAVSNNGDIIVVSPGTYTGADNRNLDFGGKAITLMSTNPNDPDIVATTIIDCEDLGRAFFFHSGEDADSIVDGFTITNGVASHGGGMYSYNSSPTVRNCVFSENSSSTGGGGMYNYSNSSPTVNKCTFIGNSSNTNNGGGMYNNNSSPEIINCTFINNSANLYGGGVYNYYNSEPNVINCIFISNSINRYGGGMCNNYNSNPKIANCTFSGNQAVYHGGGVASFGSSPEIINCILWDNPPAEIGNLSVSVSIVNYSNIKGGYAGGTGNINTDPCFVNPDANDFHLLPGSPCIDTGDPYGVYTGQVDIDGEPRVFGDFVDMGSDEACPDVEVTPVGHDFGDLEVGTSAITFVTIFNFGNANLTVSGIDFTDGSSSDFSITSGPSLPAAVEPGGFVDVEITYSPSVEGYVSAVLEIAGDAPDESVAEVALGGEGVITEIPPSQQVANILLFIEASVSEQPPTLAGAGPGNSGEGRLGALINMIEATGDLIDAEWFEEGCQQLEDAYKRTDGEPRPPDFVSGPATAELAEMLQELITTLGCE